MFRPKERDQLHIRMRVPQVGATRQVLVDAGGAGHQPDTLPGDQIRLFAQKDGDARRYHHLTSAVEPRMTSLGGRTILAGVPFASSSMPSRSSKARSPSSA